MTILLFVMLGRLHLHDVPPQQEDAAAQAKMQSKFAPGVDIMTSFGLFGRIVSMDEAENKVVIELSPGNPRHGSPPGRDQDG